MFLFWRCPHTVQSLICKVFISLLFSSYLLNLAVYPLNLRQSKPGDYLNENALAKQNLAKQTSF